MLQLKKLMKSQGFTLVELLIVIAVIGILAIAVLAALDPIEQLKKSRDTGRLADARELYSAYNRYYASYQCYPQELSNGTCVDTDWAFRAANVSEELNDGIAILISNGELKAAFSNKSSVTFKEQLLAAKENCVPFACYFFKNLNALHKILG